MLKRVWLFFAQAVTVMLAALFVLSSFKPEWLPGRFYSASPSISMPSREPAREAPQAPATSSTEQASAASATASTAVLSFAGAASRATPAVVNIVTSKRSKLPANHPFLDDPLFKRFFGDKNPEGKGNRPKDPRNPEGDSEPDSQGPRSPGAGSGVIVKPDGTILTNYHVIEGADSLEVILADGRKAKATVIGGDPETDLAVIKIDLPNLQAINFGNVESLKTGDVVLAIGNPFGVGQTVTMGIVSAQGRNQLGINVFENFIQTDAAINPGNSGGALVDSNGNLLGINTAIFSRSGGSLGIGFAIPMNIAIPVMDSILKTGSVVRGYIGVEPRELNEETAKAFNVPQNQGGVIISGILKGGPAEKAGIRTSDVLLNVAGRKIDSIRTMLDAIAQLPPEKPAKFTFLRDGKEMEFEIIVGKRPPLSEQQRRPRRVPE
jgi:serine protease DegQ